MNSDIWIIIPAFNEAPRIRTTLRALLRLYSSIVVVDDGSQDSTAMVARSMGVIVRRHKQNRGQGAALQTGIRYALSKGARYLVTFDADGQHSADEVSLLIEPLIKGRADIAFGSRFLGRTIDMPVTRYVLLKAAAQFSRHWTGIKLSDSHNGFRALSRSAAEKIRLRHERMAHASDFVHQTRRHGLRHCEIPVTVTYNRETLQKGQQSWNAIPVLFQTLLAGK